MRVAISAHGDLLATIVERGPRQQDQCDQAELNAGCGLITPGKAYDRRSLPHVTTH